MIADIIKANLNALKTTIETQVADGVVVTRNFKSISDYTDAQLNSGIVNIIATGVERQSVGLESIDRQKIAIVCWVRATDGLSIEEKEIDFLQAIEQAINTMSCANILSIAQSAQKESPYGHLGIDIEMEIE